LVRESWTNPETVRTTAPAAFLKNPVCGELRALIGRFSQGGSMEHFQMG
jgi:hypothetical protein